MRTLLGPMIYPDGTAMAGVVVILRAKRINWSVDGLAPSSIEHRLITDDAGDFVLEVAQGDYEVWYELPDSLGALQPLGPLVVIDGSAIELGELLELSRDISADYSISADWATKDWVTAQITLGAQPYDVNLNALNPGTGTASQFYKVTADGLNVEPFTFQLKDWAIGEGTTWAMMYRKADGKPGLLPVPRQVNDDTAAVLGDVITIDMDAAAGDIDITLPEMTSIAEPPVTLIVKSADYLLPHAINVLRNVSQTFNGVADDIVITRRRSMVLHTTTTNDWSFT